MKHNIVVAASGSGRSLQNLLDLASNLNFKLSGVVLSRTNCGAHTIARKANLPTFVGDFPLSDEAPLSTFLKEVSCKLIILAGFLKPFPILNEYRNAVINIHPALLPLYGGKGMYGNNIHKSVFKNSEQYSGVTVHLVNEEYDKGRKITQLKVDISKCSSAEEIAKYIFDWEKLLLPYSIYKFLEDSSFENIDISERELLLWQEKKF